MPDEDVQVQAPIETPTSRPVTNDPVWHLLFDRLDAQDENIKAAVHNTVVIANEQERLRQHVNDEQEKFVKLLDTKVGEGEVLADLWNNFRASRPAQVVAAAVVTAMFPVVMYNWQALVESVRNVF